jgi:hypothetical protein
MVLVSARFTPPNSHTSVVAEDVRGSDKSALMIQSVEANEVPCQTPLPRRESTRCYRFTRPTLFMATY